MGTEARTVTVIDDDPLDRGSIAAAFAQAGYRVETLRHAALLRHPLPSAIVLGCASAETALAFLRAQVADEMLRAVPVVAVSTLELVPSLCIDAVLTKPVRMRTLIDVVDRLCKVIDHAEEREACGR